MTDELARASGAGPVPRPSLANAKGEPANERGAPSPAAVAFVITEHSALAGARAATTTETGARANVFLGSVSGGLIALGFIGQASHLGAAFFAFGLILLPTLAFVGLTTFLRYLPVRT